MDLNNSNFSFLNNYNLPNMKTNKINLKINNQFVFYFIKYL